MSNISTRIQDISTRIQDISKEQVQHIRQTTEIEHKQDRHMAQTERMEDKLKMIAVAGTIICAVIFAVNIYKK